MELEKFELIENNRFYNGYCDVSDGNYSLKRYKKFNNKKIKEDGDIIYKLERNLTIYLKTGAVLYLKKNIRLLSGFSDDFSTIYSEYINCFINKHYANTRLEQLVIVRNKLINHKSFINDIYLLDDGKYDFNLLKNSYFWNDIELLFESDYELNLFREGRYQQKDMKFNSVLISIIQRFEKSFNELIALLEKKPLNIAQIKGCVNTLAATTTELKKYLSDNYCNPSEYVNSFSDIIWFIQGSMDNNNESVQSISHLGPLEMYRDALLQTGNSEESKMSEFAYKIERKLIFSHKKDLEKIPMKPVFYDLAYSCINFSEFETDVSKDLDDMSFN